MSFRDVIFDKIAERDTDAFLVDGGTVLTFSDFRKALHGFASAEIQQTTTRQFIPMILEPTIDSIFNLFRTLYHGHVPVLINPFWTPSEQNLRIQEFDLFQIPEAPSIVVFTSGSSSTPKPVLLSIEAFLNNAGSANKNIKFFPGHQWKLSLPLFHVGGLGIIFRGICGGGAINLGADSNRDTHISLVPTQLYRALKNNSQNLGLYKAILLGGGELQAPALEIAIKTELPIIRSYGMTETASQICATSLASPGNNLSTSGRPLEGNEIQIDETTKRVRIKSHSLMTGYLNPDGLQPARDEDGFFVTQDLAEWEGDELKILGRADRAFKCGGELIQPEKIERALLEHPLVASCRIEPVRDDEYGARPVAYIEWAEPIAFGSHQSKLISNMPLSDDLTFSDKHAHHLMEFASQYLTGLERPIEIKSISELSRKSLKDTL